MAFQYTRVLWMGPATLGGIEVRKRDQLITGLIVGVSVGAIAGLMLAPKSGQETRRLVAALAGEIRQRAGQYVGSLRRKMHEACSPERVEESSIGQVEVTS